MYAETPSFRRVAQILEVSKVTVKRALAHYADPVSGQQQGNILRPPSAQRRPTPGHHLRGVR